MGEVKELGKELTPEQKAMLERMAGEAAVAVGAGRLDELLFYRDPGKQWRWRRVAPNGETIGASTEGYHNFKDALLNFNRLTVQKVDLNVEIED